LLFAGGVAVLPGVPTLPQWPIAAGWVLGVLVGVHLVLSSWWMLTLALAARRAEPGSEPQAAPVEGNIRHRAVH